MTLIAERADQGKRLDLFVHEKLGEFSRARIQEWIRSGRVRVDGKSSKASYELHGTETIEVQPAGPAPLKAGPEDLPIDILYEDASW